MSLHAQFTSNHFVMYSKTIADTAIYLWGGKSALPLLTKGNTGNTYGNN